MSLPDTVFIFVLALIIFGPKKLPEIGRQIGKLVGEFRRASNEFKFQIEEELRQADLTDKPSTQPSIAAPVASATAAEALQPPVLAEFPADPAANIPVGQYPNIDNLNTSELDPSNAHLPTFDSSDGEPANVDSQQASEALPEAAAPTITAAEGSEPRTTVPFAATNLHVENLDAPGVENLDAPIEAASENAPSPPEDSASATRNPVPAKAEIHHG